MTPYAGLVCRLYVHPVARRSCHLNPPGIAGEVAPTTLAIGHISVVPHLGLPPNGRFVQLVCALKSGLGVASLAGHAAMAAGGPSVPRSLHSMTTQAIAGVGCGVAIDAPCPESHNRQCERTGARSQAPATRWQVRQPPTAHALELSMLQLALLGPLLNPVVHRLGVCAPNWPPSVGSFAGRFGVIGAIVGITGLHEALGSDVSVVVHAARVGHQGWMARPTAPCQGANIWVKRQCRGGWCWRSGLGGGAAPSATSRAGEQEHPCADGCCGPSPVVGTIHIGLRLGAASSAQPLVCCARPAASDKRLGEQCISGRSGRACSIPPRPGRAIARA